MCSGWAAAIAANCDRTGPRLSRHDLPLERPSPITGDQVSRESPAYTTWPKRTCFLVSLPRTFIFRRRANSISAAKPWIALTPGSASASWTQGLVPPGRLPGAEAGQARPRADLQQGLCASRHKFSQVDARGNEREKFRAGYDVRRNEFDAHQQARPLPE